MNLAMRIVRYLSIQLCCCILIAAQVASAQARIEDDWQDVERIIAIGDLHGDYDNYLQLLKDVGLVNRRGNWAAGDTHLVQLGDIPDRGPDTDRIIAHLQKLQGQAARQGGMVHVLIGNHEAMNMLGDLSYVDPGELEALQTRNSRRMQDAYYEQYIAYVQQRENPPVIDENYRATWNQQFPLGYVEHRQHWNPAGEFGSWVLQHNAVIRINNILFVHGGLGPTMVDYAMSLINDTIRAELAANNPAQENMLADDQNGPLWYRGFAYNPEETELPHLENLLQVFGVDYIVVGHTPGYGTIVPRLNNQVFLADSGISSYYGGHLSALLVEDGMIYTLQQDQRVPVPPVDAPQEALLDYLRRMQELEDVPALQGLINNLENPQLALPPPVAD